MKKVLLVLAMIMATGLMFADSGNRIFDSGTTKNCGDYVITLSEDTYHFQGKEYEVYGVHYDSVCADFKIAVSKNKKQYIAYCDDFTMFYSKDKHGFGIRRVLFTSSTVKDSFSPKAYQMQTIIGGRHVDPCTALQLIAVYLPQMRVDYNYLSKHRSHSYQIVKWMIQPWEV